MQGSDKVIILEVTLKLNLRICVNTLTIHFVCQPLALVITLIRPSVTSLALSITILKLALINISISKDVKTWTILFALCPLPLVFIASRHF